MPARFADTMKAIEAGLTSMDPAKAVKNLEAWEAHLETVEVTGAKGLAGDLKRLRSALGKDPVDGAAVGALMAKIGESTAKIAGRAEGARKKQVEGLAEALKASGT